MSPRPSQSPSEDIVVIGPDDVSNYNDDSILPESPETTDRIRDWLRPTEYKLDSSEYHKHLASHLAGTGTWLPSLQKYQQWHNSPDHGILWIKGIPGSGKSVFAARLAQMLAEEGVPVLFFFFRQIIDANHQPINLIRDWLDQILVYSPPLQVILKEYVETHRSLDSVSMEDLWKHLRTALAQLPLTYCVVDALDEMDQGNDEFIRMLAELGHWRPSHTKVLMTSRPVAAVETPMRRIDSIDIRMDESLVDVDIATYVQHTLEQYSLKESDKEAIRRAVPGRANGLFLYAKLAMNSFLEPNVNVTSILQKLPLNLDDMYSDILREHARRSGIPETTQLQILQWVTHAIRPLRLLELADLIKSTSDKSELSLKDNKTLVRAACGPLLEILPDETISVVHHSLTEFLTGDTRLPNSTGFPVLDFESTHAQLAVACLLYMHCGCLNELDGRYMHVAKNMALKFPFSTYAVENWHEHAAKCNWSGISGDQLCRQFDIFLSDTLVRINWLSLCWSGGKVGTGYGPEYNRKLSSLHIAAFCGLDGYLSKFFDHHGSSDIDVRDYDERTPLWWAVQRRFTRTVNVLLQAGAGPDIEDFEGMKPLHQAAANGSSNITRLLLEAGVDPLTPRTGDAYLSGSRQRQFEQGGYTPLQYACDNGHFDVLEAFIPHLTLDAKQLALHWAVDAGRARIVRRLLQEPDVNPNARIGRPPPLFVSALAGDVDCMEALVDAGADASIQCTDSLGYLLDVGPLKRTSSSTALEAFCTRESLCINEHGDDESDPAQFQRGFSLLLRAGADVNAKAGNGIAPLHLTRSLEVFKLLLQAGADPNAETESGETVLHCFPEGEDEDGSCLKLLMERGADLNRRERSTGKTPLLTAIKKNFHLALNMLEYKPDCTATDYDGNGPLHQALMANNKDQLHTLLSALISNGADPNLRNGNGETPLHVLACHLSSFHFGDSAEVNSYEEPLRLLISHGAIIDARDSHGRTPLFRIIGRASGQDLCRQMQVFHSASASLDVVDNLGRTLLHELFGSLLQSIGSEPNLVAYRYLVHRGVSPIAVDFAGNTLYHEIARLRYWDSLSDPTEMLEEIARAGVDMDQPNLAGQTPVQLACQLRTVKYGAGSTSCIKWLLARSKAIDTADSRGLSPIHYAASLSEYSVDILLQAGADPFVSTKDGMNALHIASRCRRSNILGRILFWMKDLNPSRAIESANQKDLAEHTPLHYASRSGRPESVALLLEAGAEVEPSFNKSRRIRMGEPWFPPILQCTFFQLEQSLWGVDPDEQSLGAHGLTIKDKSRPLDEYNDDEIIPSVMIFHRLHHTARCEEIIRMLLKAGGSLYTDSQWGDPVIFDAMAHAARHRDDYVTELLCRLHDEIQGAETPDPLYNAILMSKARRQSDTRILRETKPVRVGEANWDTVQRFLVDRQYSLIQNLYKSGANFTMHGEDDQPILQGFVECGLTDLLDGCCSPEDVAMFDDPEQNTERGLRPLVLVACERMLPNMDMLRLLVEKKGASVNARDSDHGGNTPLHVLAGATNWWQAAEAIPYLVSQGADIEARNFAGETPLHVVWGNPRLARKIMVRDAARALLELGADPNATDDFGTNLLAKSRGDEALTKLLISYGARVGTAAIANALSPPDLGVLKALLSAEGVSELVKSWTWDLRVPPRSRKKQGPGFYRRHPLLLTAFHGICMFGANTLGDRMAALQAMEALLEAGASPYDTYLEPMDDRYQGPMLSHLPSTPNLVASGVWHSGRINPQQSAEPSNQHMVEKTIVHEVLSNNGFCEPILNMPGLQLEHRDASGATLLLASCRSTSFSGLVEATKALSLLLERGADQAAADNSGRNALHHLLGSAVGFEDKLTSLKHLESVILTLVNQPDNFGYYPLHYGLSSFGVTVSDATRVQPGAPIWIDHLLSRSADVAVLDGLGNNALHYLASGLAQPRVGLSVEHTQSLFKRIAGLGVDVNGQNQAGQTPIHFLCSDSEARMRSMGFWRSEFEESEFDTSMTMLDDLGTDWYARDSMGRTALHFMASSNAYIFKQIVARGVDPLLEDMEGRTSLDMAAMHNNTEVLAMFELDTSNAMQGSDDGVCR